MFDEEIESPSLRERFWAKPGPKLPPGLELVLQEPVVVPQRGPGGSLVLDHARLSSVAGELRLLIAYRNRLLPRDVPCLAERLRQIAEELRRRENPLGRSTVRQPAAVVEKATKGTIEASIAADLALLDETGTVVVQARPLYVHVEGKGPARSPRPRANPFASKAVRIVRHLLVRAESGSQAPRNVQSIASSTGTSYAYAHYVLTALERDGFVGRTSRRSGFTLRNPVGLLRAWADAGRPTAQAIKGFYARSTTVGALERAHKRCTDQGIEPLWSLASALHPGEVFVSGLPHGAFLGGDPSPLIDALELRDVTPHNFLLLVADPEDYTENGGLYEGTRQTIRWGRSASLPQLVIDFQSIGGRGPEQADFLIERFADSVALQGTA
jgi:hypothetical protein